MAMNFLNSATRLPASLLLPLLFSARYVEVVRAQTSEFSAQFSPAEPARCIQGQNQGGSFGDGSNLSLDECFRLCLDDAQCTSLDFITPEVNQANCFISYSRNRDAGVALNTDGSCAYYTGREREAGGSGSSPRGLFLAAF
jgi:hypothetical protein